jgi:hypothetical protein
VPASTKVADARSVRRDAVDLGSGGRHLAQRLAHRVGRLRRKLVQAGALALECRVAEQVVLQQLGRPRCRFEEPAQIGRWVDRRLEAAGAEVQRYAGVDRRSVFRVDDVRQRHVEQLPDELGAAVLLLRPFDLAAGTQLGQGSWVGGTDDPPTVSCHDVLLGPPRDGRLRKGRAMTTRTNTPRRQDPLEPMPKSSGRPL